MYNLNSVYQPNFQRRGISDRAKTILKVAGILALIAAYHLIPDEPIKENKKPEQLEQVLINE